MIFPPQDKHCHGSSLVECADGSLLAVWFYGSGERTADDVQIQGAHKQANQAQWGPVFVAADTPGFPDCNPVLFIDAKNRLHLVWITVLAHGWEHSLLKTRIATNYQGEGVPQWDWQDTILLNPGNEFADKVEKGFNLLGEDGSAWSEYAPQYRTMVVEAAKDLAKIQTGWMTRIHPTTLPSGRILLPLYSDGFNLCLMAISDDQGDTWKPSDPIVGEGPIQPTVPQRKDGTLVAYMRDSGSPPARVLVSESKDEGLTWSPAIDSEIPNPGSSLEGLVLKDGRWVMVLNDTEEGRHRLALMLSEDEGKTWKYKRYLESAEPGKGVYAYPSIIQAKDGRIHLTYTHNVAEKKTIKHAAFDPEWIKASD
jgi:predicted neuraminidase